MVAVAAKTETFHLIAHGSLGSADYRHTNYYCSNIMGRVSG